MAERTINQPALAWLKKTKLIASVLAAVMSIPSLLAYPTAENDTLSTPLLEFLQKQIGLTPTEIKSLIAARPVAKLLKTKRNDEVAIFGIVRINAPQELFIEKFRDIVAFESGKGIHGVGRFQSPPVLSDVAALQMDLKELKEIPNCKPGNCPIKLSEQAMKSLREKINWSSPKATREAQSVIRQAFVDYIANYQKIGGEALAISNVRKNLMQSARVSSNCC